VEIYIIAENLGFTVYTVTKIFFNFTTPLLLKIRTLLQNSFLCEHSPENITAIGLAMSPRTSGLLNLFLLRGRSFQFGSLGQIEILFSIFGGRTQRLPPLLDATRRTDVIRLFLLRDRPCPLQLLFGKAVSQFIIPANGANILQNKRSVYPMYCPVVAKRSIMQTTSTFLILFLIISGFNGIEARIDMPANARRPLLFLPAVLRNIKHAIQTHIDDYFLRVEGCMVVRVVDALCSLESVTRSGFTYMKGTELGVLELFGVGGEF
jgi:hypothetical protein